MSAVVCESYSQNVQAKMLSCITASTSCKQLAPLLVDEYYRYHTVVSDPGEFGLKCLCDSCHMTVIWDSYRYRAQMGYQTLRICLISKWTATWQQSRAQSSMLAQQYGYKRQLCKTPDDSVVNSTGFEGMHERVHLSCS